MRERAAKAHADSSNHNNSFYYKENKVSHYVQIAAFSLLVTALIGSSYAAEPDFEVPRTVSIPKPLRPISQAELKSLRGAMNDFLKDGESAKYKDVRVSVDSEGHKHACGMVNSKNSFGGYPGFIRFVAIEMREPLFEDQSPSGKIAFSISTWRDHCTVGVIASEKS